MSKRPVLPLFENPLVVACLPASYFAFAAVLSFVAYKFVHPARSYETFLLLTLFTFPLWFFAARYIKGLVPASVPNHWLLYFMTVPSAISLSVVSVCIVNAVFDSSSERTYTVQVQEVVRSGKAYYAVVPAYVPSRFSAIGLADGLPFDRYEHVSVYARHKGTTKGTPVAITVKSGFLGIPWVAKQDIQL